MDFITDTHALLWWFTQSAQISRKAAHLFQKCEKGETVIFIPSIVMAEALSIFDKKRLTFDFKKLLKRVHASDNFIIVALDFPILQKMVDLKDVNELHDKIIVSTAKLLNLPVITKDKHLRNLAYIETIW